MKSRLATFSAFALAAFLPALSFAATATRTGGATFSIREALASGATEIVIPAGIHETGPEPLVLPPGAVLRGEGVSSVLRAAAGSKTILLPSAGSRMEDFLIDGTLAAKGSATEPGLIQVTWSDHVAITGVSVTGADRVCIGANNTNDIKLERCSFERVALPVNIVFSRCVRIANNRILDARIHGIQIWGAWQPVRDGGRAKERKSEDIIVTGNYVKNGGHGAIWGTGIARAVFANNIVDGANDVGLDLEWSEDSVITANTVRNCVNAGIALFFACRRIGISGNTILNDHPLPEPGKTALGGWWVRSGIWLTSPDRKKFPEDSGHEAITITGNTITGDGLRRRGIWIGRESRAITLGTNTFSNLGVEHDN